MAGKRVRRLEKQVKALRKETKRLNRVIDGIQENGGLLLENIEGLITALGRLQK